MVQAGGAEFRGQYYLERLVDPKILTLFIQPYLEADLLKKITKNTENAPFFAKILLAPKLGKSQLEEEHNCLSCL